MGGALAYEDINNGVIGDREEAERCNSFFLSAGSYHWLHCLKKKNL